MQYFCDLHLANDKDLDVRFTVEEFANYSEPIDFFRLAEEAAQNQTIMKRIMENRFVCLWFDTQSSELS